MNKKLFGALALTVALAACTNEDELVFSTENGNDAALANRPVIGNVELSTTPATRAAVVDGTWGKLVYQTSDVKYVIANNNLWASPLDQQLRNTLVANLSTQLPGWVVASQPLGSAQDTLNVTVTEFNGRYDGKVIVSGEWLLNHQGQLIKRPFRLEGVQTQDGYDEMVKVLASVWSQEAASIAQEIKRLP